MVVQAFRFGKEEGTVGSLILGLYDEDDQLHVVGHTSGFTAKQKRELIDMLEPYRTYERGAGEPSRWKSDEELVWEGLRPELVVEIALRPHHRQPDPPRRQVPALAGRQGAEGMPDGAAAQLTLNGPGCAVRITPAMPRRARTLIVARASLLPRRCPVAARRRGRARHPDRRRSTRRST